jgi:hypothetical protein
MIAVIAIPARLAASTDDTDTCPRFLRCRNHMG